MRVLFYALFLSVGILIGMLIARHYYQKQMQQIKDNVPECVEPVKVYYL